MGNMNFESGKRNTLMSSNLVHNKNLTVNQRSVETPFLSVYSKTAASRPDPPIRNQIAPREEGWGAWTDSSCTLSESEGYFESEEEVDSEGEVESEEEVVIQDEKKQERQDDKEVNTSDNQILCPTTPECRSRDSPDGNRESDCVITHIDYDIEPNQMKYILCPNLDYTDSDFEEDSKKVRLDDDEEDCSIVCVSGTGDSNKMVCTGADRSDIKLTKTCNASKVVCTVKSSCHVAPVSQIVKDKPESRATPSECLKPEKTASADETLFQCCVMKGGKKRWICEVCERIFKSRVNLAFHMQTHIGGKVKLFNSNDCTDSFEKPCLSKQHQKMHVDKGPIEESPKIRTCSVDLRNKQCEKRNVRLRRDTRERCPVCGVWGTSRVVTLHTANHLAGKSFICHCCHEGFFTCPELNRHIKTNQCQDLSTSG